MKWIELPFTVRYTLNNTNKLMVSFAVYTIRHRTLCLNNFTWQKSYLTIYIIFECHCAQLTLLELNTDVWATENLIGLIELTLTWLLMLVLLVSQLAVALHWRVQCKFSRAKKGRQQGRGKFVQKMALSVQPRWMFNTLWLSGNIIQKCHLMWVIEVCKWAHG